MVNRNVVNRREARPERAASAGSDGGKRSAPPARSITRFRGSVDLASDLSGEIIGRTGEEIWTGGLQLVQHFRDQWIESLKENKQNKNRSSDEHAAFGQITIRCYAHDAEQLLDRTTRHKLIDWCSRVAAEIVTECRILSSVETVPGGIVSATYSPRLRSQSATEIDRIVEEVRRQIGPEREFVRAELQDLLTRIADVELPTFEAKKRLAMTIQGLLDMYRFRVECPMGRCRKPATIRCAQVGRTKTGAFQFVHPDARTTHAARTKLPQLRVVDHAPDVGKRLVESD